ncbi:MAG: ABC transporter substrate-binding protein [Acidimicrobiales bacterium]
MRDREMGPQQPILSRRRFLSLTAASAGAVGIAALGTPSQAEASASATLRVGWNSPPDVMNPFTFTSTASNEILWLIYDTLMTYDLELKPVPSLAASEDVNADGTVFTYHLRPEATWHDGKPVTAADVKFTYDMTAYHNLGQAAWAVAEYDSSRVINDHTVEIKYKSPQAFDPALAIAIVPQHIWGSMSLTKIEGYANPHPIGSGPFTFNTWVSGQYVQVDRYAKWWGPRPAADSIIWIQYDNSDVMVQALTSGQVDILTEVPPILFDGLTRDSGVKTVEMESFSFHHIGFNVSSNPKSGGNPLLKDVEVRRALQYSLNREQLVALCLAGRGSPGSVLLPPSFGAWQEKIPLDQQFNANPEMAKSILDAAGYKMGPNGVRQDKQGRPLSFRLIAIETTDVDVEAGQVFVKAANAIGVKLTFNTLDATTLSNTVYNAAAPNWDIFIWGWDSNVPDPDYLMGIDLTDQIANNNDVYYSNPTYDRLWVEQSTTINAAKRQEIVHEMQKMYYDGAAYCIMWYQSKLQAYNTSTWTGWTPTRGGMIYNFTRYNYLRVTPL